MSDTAISTGSNGRDSSVAHHSKHSSEVLVDKLVDAFVESNFHEDTREYLPEGIFKQLLAREAVERELERIAECTEQGAFMRDYTYHQALTTWIAAEARRLFAIVLQCDLQPNQAYLAMASFHKHKYTDEKLPLLNPKESPPPKDVFLDNIWRTSKLRSFYKDQWAFQAPVFSDDQYDYNLQGNCTFPFTKSLTVSEGGAFSTVLKVNIHGDHQKHRGVQAVSF